MDGANRTPSRPRSAARLHESRRQSANLDSAPKPPARRSSRLQGPGPASPEVLTSLISSLSAISTPAEDLYDSLIPNGAVAPKSAPPTLSRSFLSHNVRDDVISEDPPLETVLSPDDAAIPPIVRTSKHPSGYSPLTAPKKGKSPTQPVLITTASIHESERRGSSFGNISVEARHKPSTTSLQTVSTLKSRSGKSLKFQASGETMREGEGERRRALNAPYMTNKGELSSNENLSGPSKNTSLKNGHGIVGGPEIPARIASWHVPSPKRSAKPSSTSPESPSSPSMQAVPNRGSSLRHSLGKTPKRKGKVSAHEAPDEKNIANDRHDFSGADESPPKGKGKGKQMGYEEDSVARRIEELKKQKELRRISQQTLAEQQRLEEAQREGGSLMPPRSVSDAAAGIRSASASTAPGKENLRPGDEHLNFKAQREPLMRSVTEPIPVDHLKTFDHIAPGRVSTSTNRALPSVADSVDEAIEEYLADPRLSQKVKDPRSGRTIAFSEVGDPTGSVVFCCVGMGTTRYLMAFYDELATTLKLRLITPDRPGIGESEPHADGTDTPLGWPDDIRTICGHLHITRFSVLAHSAGALYALATALRMPEHIRGRIHLMAPWIPPSQMVAVGIQKDHVPNTSLPYGQRLLRSLPTPFLRVANSGFFTMTSNSLASAMPKNSPKRKKRRSLSDLENAATQVRTQQRRSKRNSMPVDGPLKSPMSNGALESDAGSESAISATPHAPGKERESEYQFRLTHAIWEAATTNANPAVDLLVCLERRQDIGFRYADVNKEVVIHHGSKDTRVPVENVAWLSNRMRRCELRILEDEGHGLMASATVMSDVLSEMAREWEDWNALTKRNSMYAVQKGEKINWPLR